MKSFGSVHELYVYEIQELFSAESQLVKVLPKWAAAATSKRLRAALIEHCTETEYQIERLMWILRQLHAHHDQQQSTVMASLIEDGTKLLELAGEHAVKDAILIGAAQRIEHYEIAGYSTVRTYAHMLGFEGAALLLQDTLDEEAAADQTLAEIVQSFRYLKSAAMPV